MMVIKQRQGHPVEADDDVSATREHMDHAGGRRIDTVAQQDIALSVLKLLVLNEGSHGRSDFAVAPETQSLGKR